MIYIDTKSLSIYYNLAAEYYFAAEKFISGEKSDDIFMLWKTVPSLIIGRFQNALEEIDLAYAREKDIKICRRLSGGGTIYSDEENLMFTFIEHKAGIEIDFGRFVSPVIEVLRTLGIEAELSGRNDILIGGRKISGNAQYRAGGSVIHHGTLLLNSNLEELVRATTPKEYKIISKAVKSVRERVTNLSDHLVVPMTSDEVKNNLAASIADEVYEINEADDCRIREIAAEKFDDEKITFAASPKFDFEKTVHTSGGEFVFSISIRDGMIANASVSGDFFANASAEEIAGAVIGCEYTPSAIEKAFEVIAPKLFMTDHCELARGIFE